MRRGLIRTIIILPGTALVYVPLLIVWFSRHSAYAAAWPDTRLFSFWPGLAMLCLGLALAAWTVRLFLYFGEGTPAPWNPPKKLVVRGPYRHVRNPMITSVLIMLAAEALIFHSWPLAGWLLFAFLANAVYFPLVEERGLKKRFGDAYLQYKRHVPRWLPRLRPWTPPSEND